MSSIMTTEIKWWCETIEIKDNHIICEPHELEEAMDVCRKEFGSYGYFCVNNGKAKYHILHLPDQSCGLYYALRIGHDYLEAKRALEPTVKLRVYPKDI